MDNKYAGTYFFSARQRSSSYCSSFFVCLFRFFSNIIFFVLSLLLSSSTRRFYPQRSSAGMNIMLSYRRANLKYEDRLKEKMSQQLSGSLCQGRHTTNMTHCAQSIEKKDEDLTAVQA